MTRQALMVMVMALSAWLFVAVWSQTQVTMAEQAYDGQRQRLMATIRDVNELQSLRQVREVVPDGRRPDRDLIASIRAAMQLTGLPATAMLGVQHDQDRELEGSAIRVQQVVVRFRGLQLDQFGSWLGSWRQAGAPWRMVDYQMHADRRAANGSYDITLTLAAPYLAVGGAGESPEAPTPAP